MKNFDIQSLDKSMQITINKYSNFLEVLEFDDIYNRIKILLQDLDFINIVKDNSFVSEQSLMFNGEHKIIDLLVQNDDGYTIVDYKTTFEKSITHTEQVQIYVDAIKDITKKQNIDGYVVYLHRKNVEVVKV